MNNKILYIVRHGEIYNPNNIIYGSNIEMQLTDEGRNQIKNLALHIVELGVIPSKIYTSNLERALESAAILAKTWGISNIEKDSNLKDSFVPVIAGKSINFIKELYAKGVDEYGGDFVKQGNESHEDITIRMFDVYKKAVAQNKKCIALVSHGDPIRFLIYRLENPDSSTIPGMNMLEKTDYLPKGHAWKLFVNEYGSLLSKEIIKPD